MASQTVLALAALVCLAAIAIAHPLDDNVQVLARERRAAARRGSLAFAGYAAHTRDAPAYASPEQDAEEEDEPVKPQRPSRARPSRPPRPQVQSEEEGDEEEEDGPPTSQGSMGGGKGATAIANAYSRGNGASSNSHATAYGGRFSGGMFKHSYGK